jgi:hypothetical protein
MLYVNKSGNDETGDGSREKPFRTVVRAAEYAMCADKRHIFVHSDADSDKRALEARRSAWGLRAHKD